MAEITPELTKEEIQYKFNYNEITIYDKTYTNEQINIINTCLRQKNIKRIIINNGTQELIQQIFNNVEYIDYIKLELIIIDIKLDISTKCKTMHIFNCKLLNKININCINLIIIKCDLFKKIPTNMHTIDLSLVTLTDNHYKQLGKNKLKEIKLCYSNCNLANLQLLDNPSLKHLHIQNSNMNIIEINKMINFCLKLKLYKLIFWIKEIDYQECEIINIIEILKYNYTLEWISIEVKSDDNHIYDISNMESKYYINANKIEYLTRNRHNRQLKKQTLKIEYE